MFFVLKNHLLRFEIYTLHICKVCSYAVTMFYRLLHHLFTELFFMSIPIATRCSGQLLSCTSLLGVDCMPHNSAEKIVKSVMCCPLTVVYHQLFSEMAWTRITVGLLRSKFGGFDSEFRQSVLLVFFEK